MACLFFEEMALCGLCEFLLSSFHLAGELVIGVLLRSYLISMAVVVMKEDYCVLILF